MIDHVSVPVRDLKRARAFYEREGWSTDGVAIPEPLLGLDLLEYRRDL